MYNEYDWTAYNQDRLNSKELGKFILCEAREDNVTRLFIHRFHTVINTIVTKNGWWDTFTISKQPCNKGFYLCSIEEFKIDRNGYLNCVVYPNKYLGEKIDEDSIVWDYLFYTGRFSSEYKERHYRKRFNSANLNRVFKEKYEEFKEVIEHSLKIFKGFSCPTMEDFIFSEFMQDNITLKEIEEALEEKYDIEKLAEKLTEDMNKNNIQIYERYPLLIKKLPKDDIWKCYIPSYTLDYLQRKNFEYSSLNLGKETELLIRVEAVLQYWVDIHKKEKEERKKKKAEMKALKNENK